MLTAPFSAFDFTRMADRRRWRLSGAAWRNDVGAYIDARTTATLRVLLPLRLAPDTWRPLNWPISYVVVVRRFTTGLSTTAVPLLGLRSASITDIGAGGLFLRGSTGAVFFNDPGGPGSGAYGSRDVPADGKPHVVIQTLTTTQTLGWVDGVAAFSTSPTRPAFPSWTPDGNFWTMGHSTSTVSAHYAVHAAAVVRGVLTASEIAMLTANWREMLLADMPHRVVVPIRTLRPLWDVSVTGWSAV